jgi:hypothetical protein
VIEIILESGSTLQENPELQVSFEFKETNDQIRNSILYDVREGAIRIKDQIL